MNSNLETLIKKYLTLSLGGIVPRRYKEYVDWFDNEGVICFVSHKVQPFFQIRVDLIKTINKLFFFDQDNESMYEIIKIVIDWFNENQNEIQVNYNDVTPYLLN